jgi:PilZ domain
VTSPTPQSERRRATRALAAFPVKLSNQAGAEPAVLRDISELGLACVSPQKIPEMTLVGLDFSLPGATEMHHVKGAVVRCEALRAVGKAKARYDLAVYFTEMTPVTRAALKNYVGKGKRAP